MPAHTPDGSETMLLLPDGRVMVQSGGNVANSDGTTRNVASNQWFRLTADSAGNYANGVWTNIHDMGTERLFYASNVLPDGRVLVLGGEYSGAASDQNWTNTGEIYDPVADTWSTIANFPQTRFGDDPTAVLSDGKVLVGYLSGPATYIYDPSTNTWTTGPDKRDQDRSDEETWVKLPDGSILSYNVFGNAQHAQRYDPSTNSWIDSGSVPVALATANSDELGPGLLLPDGRVFQIGATSNTALYTPSTTTGGTGTWTAGPSIPGGLGANDAPAAMLTNGHVLFAAGSTPSFGNTTSLFEYDPVANTISQVTTPANLALNVAPFRTRMLALPSGQVLFSNASDQLWVYTPDGAPDPSWAPSITDIQYKSGSTFTLTGTQLNGLSEGASYGDDAEMSSNYPIVEMSSALTPALSFFARTANWSSTGVSGAGAGTSSTPETVDFTLPSVGPGVYKLQVVADGIASKPVVLVVGSVADDTVGLDTATVSGAPAVAVTFNGSTYNYLQSGIAGVFVDAEGGHNTIYVDNTLAGTPTSISGGGTDTIILGDSGGTVQGIRGPVSVNGPPGSISLIATDFADTMGRDVTLTADSLTGLAPAAITFAPGSLSVLDFAGGSGGNVFNVMGTAPGTIVNLSTGLGVDNVYVAGTSGPLDIGGVGGTAGIYLGYGWSLSGINGSVSVSNVGTDYLYIHDNNDKIGRAATLSAGRLDWGSYVAPITWSPTATGTGGVALVDIEGGSGGNTFIVDNTDVLSLGTTLVTGSGNDQVNVHATTGPITIDGAGGRDVVSVGSGGTLAAILGAVSVKNTTGVSELWIDDSGDSTSRFATLDDGSLTWTYVAYAAPITWTPTSSTTGGVDLVHVYGGWGGNRFTVNNTSNMVNPTYLDTGSGGSWVNIYGTSGTFDLRGDGGHDSVHIGALGGLTAIHGAISVTNPSGSTDLTIHDDSSDLSGSGDTTGRTATIGAGSLTWTNYAPPITWVAAAGTTGGVRSFQADFGSGGNHITVANLDPFANGAIISTGTGYDFLNIQATHCSLSVTNPGGADYVSVGSAAPYAGGTLGGILGPINIAPGNGVVYLYVDDSGDRNGRTATVGAGSLTWTAYAPAITWVATASLTSGGVNYLSMTGGSGGNTWNIKGLDPLAYQLDLYPGTGTNFVNVTKTNGTLLVRNNGGNDAVVLGSAAPTTRGGTTAAIQGAVEVVGNPAGSTSLVIDDSGDTSARTVYVLNSYVNGLPGYGNIYYTAWIKSLTVNCGVANPIDVWGTQAGTLTTVNCGTGNDTVNVGNGANTLDDIQGALTLNGQGGTGVLNFIDTGKTTGQTYSLGGNTLTRGRIASVTYSGMKSVTLSAGSAVDTVTLTSAPTTATTLKGGSGSNTLVGPNANETWNITGTNAGDVAGVTFTSFQNLTGGTGMDIFLFGAGATVTGVINGGGGGDWLDYSAYSTTVTVNLASGAATGVGGGVTNVRNVRGGKGSNTLTGNAQGNILIGGAGNNTIHGGSGRSILIGDKGLASVVGGSADDIVIGGYTNYDSSSTANDLALEAILAEWQSADSYTTRISKIKAGLPGGYKLAWGTTVHDSGKADTLTGGAGMDWFFEGALDTITDHQAGEQIN
jgi:hypothetical protein